MKLSVCTDAVFANLPLEEACSKVLELGYEAIEFWLPTGKNLDRLREIMSRTGLKVAAICTDFISLTDPAQRNDYHAALERTVATAKMLGCGTIISQVGSELDTERFLQHQSIVDGLKNCAGLLEDNGIRLAVEPLNLRVDHKGYYLSGSDECADIIEEVGSDNVRMLFDIYHQQITEGDIIRRIRQYIPYIAHFHSAGNPGRHELFNSELDYKRVFRAIEDTGYSGYVGLEDFPEDSVEKGLAFAKSICP